MFFSHLHEAFGSETIWKNTYLDLFHAQLPHLRHNLTRLSSWRHKTQRNDAIPQDASHSRAGSRRRVQRFLRHSLYFDVTDDVETFRIRYAFNAKAARLTEKNITSLKWPFGGDFPPIDSSTHGALQSEPGYKEIIHTRVATYGKYEDSSVQMPSCISSVQTRLHICHI